MLKIAYNTLCALAFMHEANVMHRDIKSANIILNSDCVARICDFGLARTLPVTT
jgi:mitogen-activated protein kinase 1/3